MFYKLAGIHALIIYITGIIASVLTNTKTLTCKDCWMAVFWPVFFSLYAALAFLYMIHETVVFILLLFNFRYRSTKVYKAINSWINFKIFVHL